MSKMVACCFKRDILKKRENITGQWCLNLQHLDRFSARNVEIFEIKKFDSWMRKGFEKYSSSSRIKYETPFSRIRISVDVFTSDIVQSFECIFDGGISVG
jgi:hypothetical protein